MGLGTVASWAYGNESMVDEGWMPEAAHLLEDRT